MFELINCIVNELFICELNNVDFYLLDPEQFVSGHLLIINQRCSHVH